MNARIEIPADAAGFVRRECPFCQRQFKALADTRDAASIHRHIAARLHHQNADEMPHSQHCIHCAYCGKSAPLQCFLTPQQRAYLERVAYLLAEEVRFEQLSHVRRTLSLNPYPTFVPVAPPAALPVLAEEPDDMRVIAFLCCAEDAKVVSHWLEAVHCLRCGAQHRVPLRSTELPREVG